MKIKSVIGTKTFAYSSHDELMAAIERELELNVDRLRAREAIFDRKYQRLIKPLKRQVYTLGKVLEYYKGAGGSGSMQNAQ